VIPIDLYKKEDCTIDLVYVDGSEQVLLKNHPGGNPGANLNSISH
jgi:hypothetical protein